VLLVNWTAPVPIEALLDAPPRVGWLAARLPPACAARLGAALRAEPPLEIEGLFQRRAALNGSSGQDLLSQRDGPEALLYSSLHDLFRAVKALPPPPPTLP
jgi:hypothetical protein